MDLNYQRLFNCYAKNYFSLKPYSPQFIQLTRINFLTDENINIELSDTNLSISFLNLFGGFKDIKEFINRFGLLKYLNLKHNGINQIENDTFNTFKNLMSLNLENNELTTLNKNIFIGLDCLKILKIEKNKITSIEDNTFEHLNSLIELDLKGNSLTNITQFMFNGLQRLEKLLLSNNQIDEIEDDAFITLDSLKELYLDGNKLKIIKNRQFTMRQSSLYYLDLKSNEINDISNASFDNLQNLKTLYLHSNNFNALDSHLFKSLKLNKLTLFDQIVISDPIFKDATTTITTKNLALEISKYSESDTVQFHLNSESILSIRLKQEWKCLQTDFKWENICAKLSVITGINGVGKTSLLKLIHSNIIELLKEKKIDSKLTLVKYFNSADDKLSLSNQWRARQSTRH